jgi:hypothetical protein
MTGEQIERNTSFEETISSRKHHQASRDPLVSL